MPQSHFSTSTFAQGILNFIIQFCIKRRIIHDKYFPFFYESQIALGHSCASTVRILSNIPASQIRTSISGFTNFNIKITLIYSVSIK